MIDSPEKPNFNPELSPDTIEKIKAEIFDQPFEFRYFEINGITFTLNPVSSVDANGEQNGLPAEYFFGSGSMDIYIWEELPNEAMSDKVRQILFFHEIVEIILREGNTLSENEAHELTLKYEQKFREEVASEQDNQTLNKIREKYTTK